MSISGSSLSSLELNVVDIIDDIIDNNSLDSIYEDPMKEILRGKSTYEHTVQEVTEDTDDPDELAGILSLLSVLQNMVPITTIDLTGTITTFTCDDSKSLYGLTTIIVDDNNVSVSGFYGSPTVTVRNS